MVLNIEKRLPECDVYSYIDPYKLSQVVRNLMSNAFKFTDKSNGIVDVLFDVVSYTEAQEMIPTDTDNDNVHSHNHAHSYTRTKSLKSLGSRYSLNNANTNTNTNSSHTSVDGCTHYIRFSVTDNGAGISKVLLHYYHY